MGKKGGPNRIEGDNPPLGDSPPFKTKVFDFSTDESQMPTLEVPEAIPNQKTPEIKPPTSTPKGEKPREKIITGENVKLPLD